MPGEFDYVVRIKASNQADPGVQAAVNSIRGAFGGALGQIAGFAKFSIGFEQIKGAIYALSAATDLWKGDIQAAAEAIKKLPAGIGETARALEGLLGQWTGINAEIESLNKQTEETDKNTARIIEGNKKVLDLRKLIKGLADDVNVEGAPDARTRGIRAAALELRKVQEQIAEIQKGLPVGTFFADLGEAYTLAAQRFGQKVEKANAEARELAAREAVKAAQVAADAADRASRVRLDRLNQDFAIRDAARGAAAGILAGQRFSGPQSVDTIAVGANFRGLAALGESNAQAQQIEQAREANRKLETLTMQMERLLRAMSTPIGLGI